MAAQCLELEECFVIRGAISILASLVSEKVSQRNFR